jgi:hypothetical protein
MRNVYSDKKFEIDKALEDAIRNNKLAPRWGAWRPEGKWARRALEVAVISALDAADVRLVKVIKPDWVLGVEHTEKALREMDRLLNWMDTRRSLKSEGARALYTSLHPASVRQHSKVADRQTTTARNAQTLVDARQVMANALSAYRELIDGLFDQNPGEPEKAAFVNVLADAWFYLFDVPPKKGGDSEFQKFLRAAWEDIGGLATEGPDCPESFSHAARISADRLASAPPASGWEPHWLWPAERAQSCETPQHNT